MTKQKNWVSTEWKVFNWDTSHVNEFEMFISFVCVSRKLKMYAIGVEQFSVFRDVCLLESLAWTMEPKNRVQIPISCHSTDVRSFCRCKRLIIHIFGFLFLFSFFIGELSFGCRKSLALHFPLTATQSFLFSMERPYALARDMRYSGFLLWFALLIP